MIDCERRQTMEVVRCSSKLALGLTKAVRNDTELEFGRKRGQ